jgi:hypothetical protein
MALSTGRRSLLWIAAASLANLRVAVAPPGAGIMGVHGPGMMGGDHGMMGATWTTSYLDGLKKQLAITPKEERAWKEYADTVSGVGEQMQVCTRPCSSRWARPHGRSDET